MFLLFSFLSYLQQYKHHIFPIGCAFIRVYPKSLMLSQFPPFFFSYSTDVAVLPTFGLAQALIIDFCDVIPRTPFTIMLMH